MKTKKLLVGLMITFFALHVSAAGNDLTQIKNIDLEVSVAPNPASTYVVVKPNKAIDKIEIINLLGQEVLVIEEPGLSEHIDLDDFVSNVYFIIATVDNVRRVSRLIVD